MERITLINDISVSFLDALPVHRVRLREPEGSDLLGKGRGSDHCCVILNICRLSDKTAAAVGIIV